MRLGIYWWHPVAWFARRELREAEEQCCDAWVMATLPNAGRSYSLALMETLDFLAEPPVALPVLASGVGPVDDLKRRLKMILTGTTPRTLGCAAPWPFLGSGYSSYRRSQPGHSTKPRTMSPIHLPFPSKTKNRRPSAQKLELLKAALTQNQQEAEAVTRKLRALQAKLAVERSAKELEQKAQELKDNPTDTELRKQYATLREVRLLEAIRAADEARIKENDSQAKRDAIKSVLLARYHTPASSGKKVVLLEKDGKTVLELPATWVVAEREGRLVIEIPLSKSSYSAATFLRGLNAKPNDRPEAIATPRNLEGPKASKAEEKRIADLEAHLTELMTQLESLRREMKDTKK